jgi:hypothetical protein
MSVPDPVWQQCVRPRKENSLSEGGVKKVLFVAMLLALGCALAAGQGVRIGEPYQDVYSTLRSGPYQEVAPRVENGKKELVTRRRETPDGRILDITEYYTFTRDESLQMVETHYICKDDGWIAGYAKLVQSRFTSQWGNPNYDSGGNYYWWVTGANGAMTMMGERYSPDTRSRYLSVVYTRQDLLGK